MPNASVGNAILQHKLAAAQMRQQNNPLAKFLESLNKGLHSTNAQAIQREMMEAQNKRHAENLGLGRDQLAFNERGREFDRGRIAKGDADLAGYLKHQAGPLQQLGVASGLNALLGTPKPEPYVPTTLGVAKLAREDQRKERDWEKYTTDAAAKKVEFDKRMGMEGKRLDILLDQLDDARNQRDWDRMMQLGELGIRMIEASDPRAAETHRVKIDKMKAETDHARAAADATRALGSTRDLEAEIKRGLLAGIPQAVTKMAFDMTKDQMDLSGKDMPHEDATVQEEWMKKFRLNIRDLMEQTQGLGVGPKGQDEAKRQDESLDSNPFLFGVVDRLRDMVK